MAEEWGNHLVLYLYDADGSPIGMQYRNTSYAEGVFDTYWFEKNLQGDIVAVYDQAGTKLIAYTYDAWGNASIIYSSGGASTTATYNPFRYRGYYFDSESGFYYLNSRYYDPAIGRFVTPDSFVNGNGDIIGFNMYTYCSNNPVNFCDESGLAVETLFDIISLGASIAEVAINPYDPWAWIGLVGDTADVLIPFVGGIGETTKAFKTIAKLAGESDEVVDAIEAGKIIDNTLDKIQNVAKGLEAGKNSVYYSKYANGLLEYVGISNCFKVRKATHRRVNSRSVKEWISPTLSRNSSRYVEQTVISLFGKIPDVKKGKATVGCLSNIRNSIGINGPLANNYKNFFKSLF